jgi:DNA sulfur modification protein DndD
MIIFKELILENFGPYKGKNIINLSPQNTENRSPIILFGGINGGGKTTLMDSIRLALYGRRAECPAREQLSYNDFLQQCINKNINLGEKTRIELTFEHIVDNEWSELKIVRHWGQDVKEGKDNLGIIEGDFPDLNLTQSWDEYIEKFLPLGISNLFLFDGEQVKELAEQDLPSAKVIEAIKSLLGLELAGKLALDLDILVSRKQKEFAQDDRSNELENFEEKLLNLDKEKQNLFQELQIAENQLKTANKKYRQASTNLRDQGIKIASQKETLKIKKEAIVNQITVINADLIKLSTQYLPLALIRTLLADLESQLQQEEEILKLKYAQTIFNNRDDKLLSFLLNEVEIEDKKYQQIKDFITLENKHINEKIASGNVYLFAGENSLPKLKQINYSFLPQEQEKASKNIALLQELNEQLNQIEQELSQVESPDAYRLTEQEYQREEKNVLTKKVECEKIKRKLQETEQEISHIRQNLSRYSDKNLQNKQSQHLLEMLPKVKQTLSLFQEKLTLRKLNKLESEVTNCFRYLLHKSNLISRISIASDTFALSLYNHEGSLIPKKRLSAGEKQLLAISLLWGLARVSEKHLPMAIDTPLARLDSSHRYNLIERYFPTASHQVILLSTDTEITETDVKRLREKNAIAREYLLDYNSQHNITTVKPGYFWN